MRASPPHLLLLLSATLLLLLTRTSAGGSTPANITTSYNTFNDTNRGDFFFSVDTGVSSGALQITPDSINNPYQYLVNKSGRVVLRTPYQLWTPINSTYNRVASFTTVLLVNIFRVNTTLPAGEGFAFSIVPSLDSPPPGSEGGYLGLTNATTDGNPSNHIVAIELDTVKESWDPDDNHIGLDINSVVSNKTAPLTPLGIQLAPVNATNYTVWIDYDGVGRRIQVSIAVQGSRKPAVPAIDMVVDLSKYVLQQSYFGFSASTGSDYQLNCMLQWNLTVENIAGKPHEELATWKLALIVTSSAVTLILIVASLVVCTIRRWKVRDEPSLLTGTLRSLPGSPREFEFKELKKATNNFDEKLKLGQGGFGIVYKGVLEADNIEVAVKKFSRRDKTQCQDDFLAELTIINRLRHKHLVRLVGWCHKNGVLMLVYDYMPNGSLDRYLFGGPDRPILSWQRRYTVIAGVASALQYLHEGFDQKVVHRDLKASNIMLDATFNARLGDFGLARALETDKTSYAELELGGVPGTMGYIAPESFHTGKATRESDVFAFGAVILETVCGRRPCCNIGGFQFLADWVWKLYREGRMLAAVDPRLEGEYENGEAERLLLLALACSNPVPADRPNSEVIVQVISGAVKPPAVPPFRPPFVWPSETGDSSMEESSASIALTSSYYLSSAVNTSRYASNDVNQTQGR